MKKLIEALTLGAAFILAGFNTARAAEGTISYELATSSAIVESVEISTSAAALVSKTKRTTSPIVAWYSITMYNVNTSSGVYGFSNSATVAPSLSCTAGGGIPIGSGSMESPYKTAEEKFLGMYLWALGCGDTSTTLSVVYKGR